jgi:exopolyphosphatase/guanosine-5'-triphosphate,3'-diphosphate pyrophosphatase
MVVAEVLSDGRTEVLEEIQRSIRLGHDTFVGGRLRRQTMNAAVAILRDCRRVMDTYRAERTLAVATSATREAANAELFLDRIATATELRVELIEPAEESRLIVSAVRAALGTGVNLDVGRTVVAEVGGGSTQLTFLEEGRITASASYAMGAVRLQEMLASADPAPARSAALIRAEIANTLATIKRTTPIARVDSYVAVGWEARFAASQVGRTGEGGAFWAVEADEFERFVERCSGLGPERLARKFGLPFANAETLLPALIVNHALVRSARASRLAVANCSMRDGLLLDLARQMTGREESSQAESAIQSARNIGEKYNYDAAHAENVVRLALRLFEVMQGEHGLNVRHRLLLRLAAMLHEIGSFVSSRSHHKHSLYLIRHSELFGLRQEEREVVAAIARYHRRSVPRMIHLEYRALSRQQRLVVNRLAALLRVADALVRGHAEQVLDFRLSPRRDELTVLARGVGELTLEQRSLARKADLFEDVYGMNVRMEEAGPDEGSGKSASG